MTKLSVTLESKHRKTPAQILKSSLFVTGFALFTLLVPLAAQVNAATYQEQINQLKQQNTQSAAARAQLESQEDSLAATLASLQARIAELEAQIRANQAQRDDLARRIADAEAEIVRQRHVLALNIKEMYLSDRITTVEMLASSRNLSEFVDKQQYEEAVQAKIKTTLERINALKSEMEHQKATIEKLLVDQQGMQSELDGQRAENARLLSLNLEQQAAFDRDIKNANARIAELRRQQAAENAKHFKGGVQTGGTGSYPWANVAFPNTMPDPWGMYKRQCVSYTAWKVANSGRHMPYWGGRGNAKQWDDNARAAGIPVDTTPKAGDVAVSNYGTYGHVMYVEAVHGDGTITISQYNANWDGKYSTGRRSAAGLVFIHF